LENITIFKKKLDYGSLEMTPFVRSHLTSSSYSSSIAEIIYRP